MKEREPAHTGSLVGARVAADRDEISLLSSRAAIDEFGLTKKAYLNLVDDFEIPLVDGPRRARLVDPAVLRHAIELAKASSCQRCHERVSPSGVDLVPGLRFHPECAAAENADLAHEAVGDMWAALRENPEELAEFVTRRAARNPGSDRQKTAARTTLIDARARLSLKLAERDLLSIVDVAKELSVSTEGVDGWVKHGLLPAERLADGAVRVVAIPREAVVGFGAARRKQWAKGIGPTRSLLDPERERPYGQTALRRWDGKFAPATAAERGKKPGPPITIRDKEAAEVVHRFQDLRQSQQTIANAMTMSRKQVRGVLKRAGLAN